MNHISEFSSFDLRRGNMLTNRKGEVVFTNPDEINDLLLWERTKYDESPPYVPIALDAEWLKRLGFDNTGDIHLPLDGLLRVEIPSVYIFGSLRASYGDSYYTGIMYVHQLQNLYYALTREELKLTYSAII